MTIATSNFSGRITCHKCGAGTLTIQGDKQGRLVCPSCRRNEYPPDLFSDAHPSPSPDPYPQRATKEPLTTTSNRSQPNGSLGVADSSLGVGGLDGSLGVVERYPDGTLVIGDKTLARARVLGIESSLIEPFRCVLPGHDHKSRLHSSGSHWTYRCLDRGRGLAEVRAALAYADASREIRGVEAARWGERLDWEAGVLDRHARVVTVPEGASSAARRVAEGIGLFLGLRHPMWPPGEPFLFAREFCMAYCGVTDDVARRGMQELDRLGVVDRTGRKVKFSIEWVLGGGAP